LSWAYPSAVGRERGAFHGIDLLLLLDYARISRDATGDAVAVAMRRYWTRFAKTGNPNAAGLPNWPAYDTRTGAYLEIGPRIEARTGLRAKAFALVDRVYAGRLRASKP
jgi:carboxylesterase type B